MKQTAVALIFEKFNLLSDKDFKSWMLNNYDELFEMEKEQILESYKHGQNNGYMYRDGNSNIIRAYQYYNETFKSE